MILLFVACTPYSQDRYNANSNRVLEVAAKEDASNDDLQRQFLTKLNTLRAQGRTCGDQYYPAANPLKLNDSLILAAYRHSLDMSTHGFLDHVSSNGDTLVDRLEKANYSWNAIAENVAHNQRNIEQVLEDWLGSPGHCSNMMSAEYNHTGVAQVNWYWTQVYASPR